MGARNTDATVFSAYRETLHCALRLKRRLTRILRMSVHGHERVECDRRAPRTAKSDRRALSGVAMHGMFVDRSWVNIASRERGGRFFVAHIVQRRLRVVAVAARELHLGTPRLFGSAALNEASIRRRHTVTSGVSSRHGQFWPEPASSLCGSAP